jgi:hypothetical protein
VPRALACSGSIRRSRSPTFIAASLRRPSHPHTLGCHRPCRLNAAALREGGAPAVARRLRSETGAFKKRREPAPGTERAGRQPPSRSRTPRALPGGMWTTHAQPGSHQSLDRCLARALPSAIGSTRPSCEAAFCWLGRRVDGRRLGSLPHLYRYRYNRRRGRHAVTFFRANSTNATVWLAIAFASFCLSEDTRA